MPTRLAKVFKIIKGVGYRVHRRLWRATDFIVFIINVLYRKERAVEREQNSPAHKSGSS